MRKLATLTVWLDEAPQGDESSYTKHEEGSSDYEIFLRPKADQACTSFPIKVADVFAHELGHFVADVLRTPATRVTKQAETPVTKLRQEQEAWHFAERMVPGIKGSPVEKDALAAYQNIVAKVSRRRSHRRNGVHGQLRKQRPVETR